MENLISDCYLSISAPSKGVYKDNGSKFLAFAHPVETEAEVKDLISKIKKEYFDATHHCFAYRLGLNGDVFRSSDDGEPSSTAGKPILGQLLSNKLSDILVVVVRYFGGVKLGVPGLIKAYKSATAEAIASAKIVEKIASEGFEISFPYEQMNSVMKTLKDFDIAPKGQKFDNQCSMEVRVRLRDRDRFLEEAGKWAEVRKTDTNN